ncbi:uncharacterized protein METZ01_LOCUS170567, partial [marine metagenome]
DNTAEIVSSYPSVILLKQNNKGPSVARNRGMNRATGNWISFLDADDTWKKNKLELQKNIIDKYPDLKWVSAAFVNDSIIRNTYTYPFHSNGLITDFFDAINNGLIFNTSTMLLHENIFKNENFRFNHEFRNSEDTEMWLRLACHYPRMGYVHQAVATYIRSNKSSLTKMAFSSLDFSFLSVESRLKKEIDTLTKSKKKLIELYLKNKREQRLLRYWAFSRKSIKQHPDHYINYFSKQLYLTLLILNWTPSLIKRLLSKILKIY